MDYAVRIARDDNGTYMVTLPDMPGVLTYGDDYDDALARAVDALETMIQATVYDKEAVPLPKAKGKLRVTLPTQTALKVLLHNALIDKGMNRAQLARALHWRRPQVDRLFDLGHASRLDQIDAAMDALGSKVEVRLEPRA